MVQQNNKIIIVVMLILISILILFLTTVFNSDVLETTSENSNKFSIYIEKLVDTHPHQLDSPFPFINFHGSINDVNRMQQDLEPLGSLRVTLNESEKEFLVDLLKPNSNSVVIYPIFTSAAYSEPGFYTYYSDDCDESCVTDLSFDTPEFKFTSSGMTAQILYHVGYTFLTDAEVDKNPEILQNYDTVILLHNEYVTKKAFDAISNHSNLIFLFPNALYAEVTANHDDDTITLIRGHGYPDLSIKNGFNYEIEEKFHDYEYDTDCLDWEFLEIENGYHLNCYPDAIIHKNLEILVKMKEL